MSHTRRFGADAVNQSRSGSWAERCSWKPPPVLTPPTCGTVSDVPRRAAGRAQSTLAFLTAAFLESACAPSDTHPVDIGYGKISPSPLFI